MRWNDKAIWTILVVGALQSFTIVDWIFIQSLQMRTIDGEIGVDIVGVALVYSGIILISANAPRDQTRCSYIMREQGEIDSN